jgi:TPR repeat protein
MAGDETHTLKTLVDAAQKGDAAAQFELGRRYYRGEGAPQNNVIAIRWFRRAADQGHVVSKIYVSELAHEDNLSEEPALQRWLKNGNHSVPLAPSPLPATLAKPRRLPNLWRRAAVSVFIAGLGLALVLFLWWWQGNLPGLR